MSVALSDVVRKVKAHASRSVEGEALVVLVHSRQLHRLNSVGTHIWEVCDQSPVRDIVHSVVAEFEVEREVAERDVCEFLQTMETLGAIEIERDGTSAQTGDA